MDNIRHPPSLGEALARIKAQAEARVEEIAHEAATSPTLLGLKRQPPPDIHGKPGTWKLTIPGWTPVLLNKLRSAHHIKANRMKKADAEMVAFYANLQQIPRVRIVRSDQPRTTGTGKPTVGKLIAGTGPRRRVSIHIVLPKGERRGDRDGYYKSALDSLVACQRLVTDSPVWSEEGGVTFDRAPVRATQITLEDLPE